MKEAVIVSTARTPIGRAYRGAFNNTNGPTMGGHVIAEAVRRAAIDARRSAGPIVARSIIPTVRPWAVT